MQQTIHRYRGRKDDPLYRIRMKPCAGAAKDSPKSARLHAAISLDERHDEVHIAWQCAQQLRDAYRSANLAEGRRIAQKVLASFPTCPIPENKRLGQTLNSGRPRSWPTRHRPSIQRRQRSHQRTHRAPPPHRPRVPQTARPSWIATGGWRSGRLGWSPMGLDGVVSEPQIRALFGHHRVARRLSSWP